MMPSAARKALLIAHVVASVGWLGSVLTFLVLAFIALSSQDASTVRAMYTVLAITGWYVIIPFSFAALVTGCVQSLVTEWGLLRHYWLAIKLVLTVGATALLPVHLTVASRLARIVAEGAPLDGVQSLRQQITIDAAMASVVLLIATILSVYKPWGQVQLVGVAKTRRALRGRYVLGGLAAFILILIAVHLSGITHGR